MTTEPQTHSPQRISYKHPTIVGIVASAILTGLVIIGSRNLEHFDSALIGYTIASIVAIGAIFFRYALWLQRPATRVYFRRGLQLFFQRRKLTRNSVDAAKTLATNLVEQRFIFKRGKTRWLMHFLIMPGLMLQRLTTREPDDAQLEVALSALIEVLKLEDVNA